MTTDAQRYVRLVWAAYCEKLGQERIMSPAEFALVTTWRDGCSRQPKIPLRVVLHAIDQTPHAARSLAYYGPAVIEAARRREKALG